MSVARRSRLHPIALPCPGLRVAKAAAPAIGLWCLLGKCAFEGKSGTFFPSVGRGSTSAGTVRVWRLRKILSGLSFVLHTLYIVTLVPYQVAMTAPPSKARSSTATEVFRHGAADLQRFLRSRLRDPEVADDVVQEVFSRLVRVKHIDLVRDPHSYLFGIAFHVIREMRLLERRNPVSYDSAAMENAAEHPSHVTPDEMAEQLNVQSQVERALARLPTVHRALVLMCKRDGMTYGEAAAATGISVHMVEKHLIQARIKLLSMIWDL